MPRGWETLDTEDDLVAMERSCMRTFVSPSQVGALLESLYKQEQQSTLAFVEKFAPTLLLPEEQAMGYDEWSYLPEEEDDEAPPGSSPEISS